MKVNQGMNGRRAAQALLLALTIGLASGCTMYTEQEYTDKVQEMEGQKRLAEARTRDVQKLEAQLAEKNRQLQDAQDHNRKEVTQLSNDLVTSKVTISREQEIHDQLEKALREELAAGEVQLANLTTLRLEDKVLFDSGKAQLKPSGLPILRKIGMVLQNIQGQNIQVEGHTDNVPMGDGKNGKFPSNWELSTGRATTVVRYLTEIVGMDPARLSAAGYGQQQPIADNETPAGRQINRRVEFTLKAPNMNASAPVLGEIPSVSRAPSGEIPPVSREERLSQTPGRPPVERSNQGPGIQPGTPPAPPHMHGEQGPPPEPEVGPKY